MTDLIKKQFLKLGYNLLPLTMEESGLIVKSLSFDFSVFSFLSVASDLPQKYIVYCILVIHPPLTSHTS